MVDNDILEFFSYRFISAGAEESPAEAPWRCRPACETVLFPGVRPGPGVRRARLPSSRQR